MSDPFRGIHFVNILFHSELLNLSIFTESIYVSFPFWHFLFLFYDSFSSLFSMCWTFYFRIHITRAVQKITKQIFVWRMWQHWCDIWYIEKCSLGFNEQNDCTTQEIVHDIMCVMLEKSPDCDVRSVIKFLWKEGVSRSEIHSWLSAMYGANNVMSKNGVY